MTEETGGYEPCLCSLEAIFAWRVYSIDSVSYATWSPPPWPWIWKFLCGLSLCVVRLDLACVGSGDTLSGLWSSCWKYRCGEGDTLPSAPVPRPREICDGT